MSNLPIYQELSQLDEQEQKLAIQKSLYLKKAFESSDVEEIYKAQQWLNKNNNLNSLFQQKDNKGQGHRSLIFDPFETNTSQGFFHKNAQVSFELLRQMSKSPIINAVISTRKDQVLTFCEPQMDKYSKGFIIRRKSLDKNEKPNDRDKREVDRLTKFLIDCSEDEDIFDMDDFDSFIKKIIDDSLTLDQACFEIVHNKLREPVQIVPVDAATIRLADSYDNVNNVQQGEKKDGYYPSYVQIYQNRIWQEYYPWEMCVGIRNPQTALNANGYGKSELEILIATVTAMLNADSYNNKFFQNGTAPKGALLVKSAGGVNKDKLAELRRDWNATMVGSNNFHKTPVLDAEKIEWLDLQKSNRDMEFSHYQEYLVKLACAVYKISPEEIGFPLQGSSGGGLNGGNTSHPEEKEYSINKGLRPLLKSLQTWINKFIIGPKSDNKYEFLFAGFDSEDSKEEEDRLTKAVTTYMTVDEVRGIRDLEPLPDGKGSIILNPIMMQQKQMEMQQKQMMAQNAQPNYDDYGSSDGEDNGGGEYDKVNPFVKALENWWDKEMVTNN